MKLSTVTILASIASVSAFAPSAPAFTRSTELCMTSKESSRLQFLQTSAATIAASILVANPQPSNAAKYGSFGAGSPEVIDPKSAIIDDEILASEAVQKSISAIRAYLDSVNNMKSALASNPQADIGSAIRGDLDFVKLRADLNVFNSAFDEDTQRGTDRIIRLIMQDITELEAANRQKPGVERSEKRLDIMKGKLDKLTKAFSDYLAFV